MQILRRKAGWGVGSRRGCPEIQTGKNPSWRSKMPLNVIVKESV
jgi:hypothetical protein